MHARHRPGISREAGYGTWFPCRAPGVCVTASVFAGVVDGAGRGAGARWTQAVGIQVGAGLARCGIQVSARQGAGRCGGQVGAGQGIVCRIFAHAHRRAESLRHKKIASRCACQRLSP